MAGPRLDDVKDNVFRLPSRINSTWGGNLTDMVRATHYLRIMEDEDLVEHAALAGAKFVKALRALAVDEPILSAVRGRGLMLAFDLPDRETHYCSYHGLYETGLPPFPCGELSS